MGPNRNRVPFSLLILLPLVATMPGSPVGAQSAGPASTGDAAVRAVTPASPDENLEQPREIPDDLDTSRRHLSEERKFLVSIHDLGRGSRINKIHNWSVRVLYPDRRPVRGAAIKLDGGMPAHHHGFPTHPRVTRSIGDGLYLVEGVKFNMTGWWRFEFEIRAGEVTDRVAFNVVIQD